jgi:hypothetical protein
MKHAFLVTALALASLALALDGQFGIHDPSTVVRSNGRFYTYGTGGSSRRTSGRSPRPRSI